jgi:hypothetical protein
METRLGRAAVRLSEVLCLCVGEGWWRRSRAAEGTDRYKAVERGHERVGCAVIEARARGHGMISRRKSDAIQ